MDKNTLKHRFLIEAAECSNTLVNIKDFMDTATKTSIGLHVTFRQRIDISSLGQFPF